MNGRSQFVRVNQYESFRGKLEVGLLQGSILGPLLFLLYVNDLPNISNKLSYIEFADDISIFISRKSIHDIFYNEQR